MNNWVMLICLIICWSCIQDVGQISTAGNTTDTNNDNDSGDDSSTVVSGPDPLVSESWHFRSTGSNKGFSKTNATLDQDMGILYVQEELEYLGKGVTIAISDTGSQTDHPDLKDNVLPNAHRNYSSSNPARWGESNVKPSIRNPHGTSVAGITSAVGWNGIGSRGVAPSSNFASYKYLVTTTSVTDETLLLKELHQLYGAFDILNMSYGYSGKYFVTTDTKIEDALKVGVTELRSGKGALYVRSAGNSYQETHCPGLSCYYIWGNANSHEDLSNPYLIVVGAVNAEGKKASYSSPGSNLWVSATGGEDGTEKPAIITTDQTGCNLGYSILNSLFKTLFDFGFHSLNKNCDYTNSFNGTSAAAPMVSGVIALMLEANPELTWRDVKHILATTADRVDYIEDDEILLHPEANKGLANHVYDYKWVKNKADIYFSNHYGFGRVNAKEAVEAAIAYKGVPLPVLGTFEQTIDADDEWYYDSKPLTGKSIPDADKDGVEHQIWVGHDFVIENIKIQLKTTHPSPGELAVILKSPQGTESRLLNINSRILGADFSDFFLSSNAFYGEESLGFWTIKIVDGKALNTGDLTQWKILVSGHRNDLTKPYPPTGLLAGAVTNSEIPLTFAASITNASQISQYKAQVIRASDEQVMWDWAQVEELGTNSYTFKKQPGEQVLESGVTYYLKVVAVNTSDNPSSEQLISVSLP